MMVVHGYHVDLVHVRLGYCFVAVDKKKGKLRNDDLIDFIDKQ